MGYVVTIQFDDHNPFTKEWGEKELTGEFDCISANQAIKQAKEVYAHELGTTAEEKVVFHTNKNKLPKIER